MEDEIADAAERGAQCRTVADRHERVSVGCVEAAGGEHEAPDHKAAGYGEQTGDERQSARSGGAVCRNPAARLGRRNTVWCRVR